MTRYQRSSLSDAPGHIEGPIKFFNDAKGYGFISRGNGQKDVFIHITALRRAGYDSLKEGDMVSATFSNTGKGPEVQQVLSVRRA
jgi:CspA family cold shock protein